MGRRFTLFVSLFFFFVISVYGQIPPGYYDGAKGLSGSVLKDTLCRIITRGHHPITYSEIWDAFAKTDVRPGGDTIWDIYSDVPGGNPAYYYMVGQDQCGTYSGEGDCYNREHSFPKSWWGGTQDTQYTDLNHIFATDGYVNMKRSNYPYGDVGNATWTSTNGSKLGTYANTSDYDGTVFEPIDAYKGDVARALFYMATRYKDKIPQWVQDYGGSTDIDVVFQSDGSFNPWYYAMMYQWHLQDPVSAKERMRNDSVYKVQGNRNPYIDHPEFVCLVFGNLFVDDPSNFTANSPSDNEIDLTWNLNSNGDQVVLAYSTTGFFGMPNGTYNVGDTIAGGGKVLYVGTNTSFNHTGLTANQKYYYKLWSYDQTTGRYSCGVLADATAGGSNSGGGNTGGGDNGGGNNGSGCASDLFISEYGEGSSYNKFLEIYNGTGADVNMSDYSVVIYSNGNTSGNSITLNNVTLANGDVYVIANNQANSTITGKADQLSGSLTFNGDDAVVLKHNGTAIDQIGVVGEDPGSGWSVAGVSNATKDHTLVRKSTVTSGTTDWSTSAGTDADNSQWIVYVQDFTDSLGTHYMQCSSNSCSEPTTQASNLTVDSYDNTSISLSWTNGDGDYRIVLAKQGSPVDGEPTDGTTYSANAAFGSGDQIGTGNYVVYSGNGNSVTVTGLVPGTTYYFKVFEYNCTGGNEDYLTTNPPEISQTTKPDNITDLQVVCTSEDSISLTWSLPSGNYDGIVILALDGNTPPAPTCEPSNFSNPNRDYSAAEVYCSNSDNAKYVYNDVGNSVVVKGLTANSVYHFVAYVYAGNVWSAAGNEVVAAARLKDVSDLTASCGDQQSTITWTNPNSTCFDEVILAVNSKSITATPTGTYTANSTDYTDASNPTLSDGSVVVYNGTGNSVTVTGLTNDTTYYFKVFVRKGTKWSQGVEVSCTPYGQTILYPNDLVIVAVNTDYYDNDNTKSDDEIEFICFKDITPGTSIDFTDNGYERKTAGLWGDTEGTIRFTRNTGTSVIPAGTVIKIRGEGGGRNPQLGTDWNIWVGGTLDNDNWTVENLNVVGNQAGDFDLNEEDQVWIMQGGDWETNGTFGSHDDIYTGNVLYGWTATGWETAPGYGSTSGSTLYPTNQCSNTDVRVSGNVAKVRYVGDTSIASQREWIARVHDSTNWQAFNTTQEYEDANVLPNRIRINGEGFKQEWVGDVDDNWFNCSNWGSLRVPDSLADATYNAETAKNDIVFRDGDTAVCHSLTITGSTINHKIYAKGISSMVLKIYGDLNINTADVLDFDDQDASTQDGNIIIKGNWNNNVGLNGFKAGNSTVEFAGSTAQTINSVADSESFNNLIISNQTGVVSNVNLNVGDTLDLNKGVLDLNGKNLTISGDFINNQGYFVGDAGSNLTIKGSGRLDNIAFKDDYNLKNFVLNRDATANIVSDLTIANNLIIDQGQVALYPGKFYTVNGTLTNNVGSSGLLLKSDPTGTASLIFNTPDVEATCQRYLSRGQWHYIFSPLSDVPRDSLTVTSWGANNPNFYWYDESKPDYWWANGFCSNVYGWTNESSSKIDTSKGYIFYSSESRIYNLSGGTLKVSDKTFNLSYTQSGTDSVVVCDGNNTKLPWTDFDGWNLIGNPFTAAIDWDNSNITFNNVENVIYYYDGSTGNYKYYRPASSSDHVFNHGITVNGGSRYVPANQAFMIKATAPGASITIPASARVHNSQILLKSAGEAPNIVRMKLTDGTYSDETVIQLANGAMIGFDATLDAHKRFAGNTAIPQIFSLDANHEVYAINTLPLNIDTVKLGYYIANDGYYTLQFSNITLQNYRIWFVDNQEDTMFRVKRDGAYQFYTTGGMNYSRFKLVFKPDNRPYVTGKLADLHVVVGQPIMRFIPDTLFKDPDIGDSLRLTITCNGAQLPQWLSFKDNLLVGVAQDTGTYEITLTATDEFEQKASTSFKIYVEKSSSKRVSDLRQFKLYPNPAADRLWLTSPSSKGQISIYNVEGKLILQQQITSRLTEINVKSLPAGHYVLVVKAGDKQLTFKFEKQ